MSYYYLYTDFLGVRLFFSVNGLSLFFYKCLPFNDLCLLKNSLIFLEKKYGVIFHVGYIHSSPLARGGIRK